MSAGSTITIDVDTPFPFFLDSFVVLYDSAGGIVDVNDDDGASVDSFLEVTVPTADDYYVSVGGFGSFSLADPFDSSSGSGAASEGDYDVTIGLDLPQDIDVYSVDLEAGDVIGATVFNGADHLTLYDPGGAELIGSGQDAALFAHPFASPLPAGGNASLSWVVDTTGAYTVAVDRGTGPYLLQLRAFRTELEQQNRLDHQILFLDFDGETIDATQVFGFGNPIASLSPLSSFLDGWGLTAADEDAVIDSITDSVKETFRDIGLIGNNGDFATDGIDGHYDVEIVTSRDITDPFGFPLDPFGSANVSRVIVGGSINELGIGTIGIAESIDVGNFETKETAVTLLDLLSAPSSNPNSLNQFVGPPTDIIELVGVGVGNIVAHEAGHFFGTWHTDQFNAVANIMDQGGNLPNSVGVGPDGIFGTVDDVDVDFGQDTFVLNEGFTGTEDTLNAIAFGLSTGLNDPGMIVVDSDPVNNGQLFSKPSDFTIQFIDPVDPLTVDNNDLTVNGIAADSVSGSGTTLTFHFNSSPVTAEGLQTMAIAADAVSRLSDGDGVSAFNATFGYDEVLMQVTSVNPADGSIVQLPFDSITVQVNEPYAVASVGTDDLIMSQGSVVGFNPIDNFTIEYLLSGISNEGDFTVQMPDGALNDSAGNLGEGFDVTYQLDFGVFPYPIPLDAKNPLGSLIYDPSVNGMIGPGDSDLFTISVDPGQTVTVVVEPALNATRWEESDGGNGNFYALTDASVDVFEAEAQANALGGHLVSITSPEEQAFIEQNFLAGSNMFDVYWIGANDADEEGVFEWTSGEPFVYDNWDTGEPNDFGAGEDYAAINWLFSVGQSQGVFGGWNDTVGSDTYFGIMEFPATAFQPRVELGIEGRHLTSDRADAPGEAAVIQTAGQFANTTNRPKTFEISVTGLNDTVGAYNLQVILNAAVEAENHDGPSNDTEPQDISASFLKFGTGGKTPARGAALGTTDAGGDDRYSFSLRRGESVDIALTGGSGMDLQLFDPMGNLVAEDVSGQGIVNGSFETGDFTGWTVVETAPPFIPWQVSGAGVGAGFGMAPTDPQDGSFVAWNGFDGFGPMQFQMWQDFTVPTDPTGTTLNWQDRTQWFMAFGATLPRDYSVQLRDPTTDALLATLFSFSTGDPLVNPVGDTGWQSHSADLTAFAGQAVRLFIEQNVPEPFTGPAQIEFDDFVLSAGSAGPANVDNVLRNVVADETGVYTVRVTGNPDVQYSLVATRNMDFDLEDNDSIATAQPILATSTSYRLQYVLGHVSSASSALYASNRDGGLYTLDTATGVGSFVGSLPGGSTEIEHNNDTGQSFVQFPNGALAGQEFDIETAAGIGAPVFNGFAYNGLEWVGDTLYGTAIAGPGFPSELRILDPSTGASVGIGPTGVGPISGIAYDDANGVMYGIAGGGGPADLFTIDLTTGAATSVGSTGIQAGSLEFGPDGNLYAGGTGASLGELHQIDVNTGAGNFVGPTGIGPVTGLALRQAATTGDFYEINLRARQPFFAGTLTPADGPGEFVNELDPMVRLYDAAGNLVASNDNSASDGRNALLRYRAPRDGAGTYYVEVIPSDAAPEPTSGEYILWMFGVSKTPPGGAAAAAVTIGDANRDGYFDSSDLVTVFQAGEYEDGIADNSTFKEGDWNRDGDFDSSDLVLAFQSGFYDAGFVVDDTADLDEMAAALERQVMKADDTASTSDVSRGSVEVERREIDLRVDNLFADRGFEDGLPTGLEDAVEELVNVLGGEMGDELI